MSTESLLDTMLEHDRFHDQDTMVAGIAQRAVNIGYENLTPRQKAVLVPFLTQPCDGVTDPLAGITMTASIFLKAMILRAPFKTICTTADYFALPVWMRRRSIDANGKTFKGSSFNPPMIPWPSGNQMSYRGGECVARPPLRF
ncbi:hypothetical protein LT989_07110 [Citrobacter portucalensis]|uniref:hypothetical protein n=1 Tax=Citrobacter portucalensis TaxID=1639133 RepID=UPI001E3A8481|nr:hypothetical protein [Citrobacter portucalensis]UHD38421.1 hypothetical protein LT989_07110 [Citrobacter portucalensis]